jgi:two-component system, OmpR family, sensor kinase
VTLRRRILLGCGLIAAVLLVADLFLAATVRSVLLEGVDSQLTESARRITRLSTFRLFGPGQQAQAAVPATPAQRTLVVAPPDGQGPEVLTDLFIGVVGGAQAEVAPVTSALGAPASELPRIDPEEVAKHVPRSETELEPFTLPAADGSHDWRLVAAPGAGPEVLVVGMSLEQMADTLQRVLSIAGVMTVAILATLAAVAIWMIRLGVRPMTEMAGTAEAIAAGQLHHRVSVDGAGTEAARLGSSLNRMLERIEEAFAARSASEERLRLLVADASHELRTPLTSILGYAELWRSGGLDDAGDRSEAMRRLDEEARRMGVLVDDLLLLAHLDEGRPLERKPVDLDRIVADAVADARAIEPDRPITLEAAAARVTGDDSRLRQVTGNLLANARVHTPPGTPVHVVVTTTGEKVRLEVADEGPGIDPENRDRLFERFYRADPARSRGSGGSGLGLAIVAAVVEAHHGEVRVDEPPGGGARFVVELPAAPQFT